MNLLNCMPVNEPKVEDSSSRRRIHISHCELLVTGDASPFSDLASDGYGTYRRRI